MEVFQARVIVCTCLQCWWPVPHCQRLLTLVVLVTMSGSVYLLGRQAVVAAIRGMLKSDMTRRYI